jgi:excisionase family DNA binding protein
LRALPDTRQPSRLLDVDEVATALECSRRTVFRLFASGDLRSIKVGRTRRVVADDVDAYIDARRNT